MQPTDERFAKSANHERILSLSSSIFARKYRHMRAAIYCPERVVSRHVSVHSNTFSKLGRKACYPLHCRTTTR